MLCFRWWLRHVAVQMLPEVSVWDQMTVSPGRVPGELLLCVLSPGAEGFGRDGVVWPGTDSGHQRGSVSRELWGGCGAAAGP